jgi:hypothetical protein
MNQTGRKRDVQNVILVSISDTRDLDTADILIFKVDVLIIIPKFVLHVSTAFWESIAKHNRHFTTMRDNFVGKYTIQSGYQASESGPLACQTMDVNSTTGRDRERERERSVLFNDAINCYCTSMADN